MKENDALLRFHSAHSFATAAMSLSNMCGEATHTNSVQRFLFAHAFELYLKSFLMLKGFTSEKLKEPRFGHNLKNLLDTAKDYDLAVAEETLQALQFTWGERIAFADRYLERGHRRALPIENLVEAARELHDAIASPIYEANGLKRHLRLPETN